MSRPASPRRSAGAWGLQALCIAALLPALRLPEVTQTHSGSRSLRGLPGVAVLAEEVGAEAKRYGLDADWLERNVTRRLERDSIPLLGRSDALLSRREPVLVVRIQTVRVPGREAFAWHLSLALHQKLVAPGTTEPAMLASTWEATATIGITSGGLLRSSVQETLEDRLAEFVRAWKRRDQDD